MRLQPGSGIIPQFSSHGKMRNAAVQTQAMMPDVPSSGPKIGPGRSRAHELNNCMGNVRGCPPLKPQVFFFVFFQNAENSKQRYKTLEKKGLPDFPHSFFPGNPPKWWFSFGFPFTNATKKCACYIRLTKTQGQGDADGKRHPAAFVLDEGDDLDSCRTHPKISQGTQDVP